MLLMAPWVTNSSVYGKCQLWKASKRAGIDIGWEQTARIMRELGIHGANREKKRFTTSSDPAAVRAPDPIHMEFTATRPNAECVADFERHEALSNPAVVKGHRPWLVAASR